LQGARKLDPRQYPYNPRPPFLGQYVKLRTRTPSGLRRTLILWIAVLGVLSAPVAETVHEFTHLRAAHSKQGMVRAACATCAAYAAMGHALTRWPLLEPAPQASEPGDGFTPHAAPRVRPFFYLQRAPPLPSPSA
jgi:hypothetical protein